jgi:aspartate racemase
MKTAGIVGGIGPESTIDYYRQMVATYRRRRPDGSFPPILINSIDLTRMLDLIGTGKMVEVTDYLVGAVKKLERAGADFALLAANTPHVVFNEIQQRSPIPMISIVEAACAGAKARNLTRLGLFGTRFTMQGSFYPDVFFKQGIDVFSPGQEDQDYIHEKYMSELVHGVFLDETRRCLLAIVDRLIEQQQVQGVILGGTELPLILRDETYRDIPFLDTTRIHVERAVARILS